MKGNAVMAIDGAGWCGVVVGVPGKQPTITTWKLPHNPDALGETLLDFKIRFDKELARSRVFGGEWIGTCVFEKPILNPKQLNLNTGRKLYGITGIIEMICYQEGIDCYEIAAGTWKKVFCGRGNVSKKEIPYPPMTRCHKLGWKVNNMDEADACGLFYTWCARLQDDIGLYAGPLFDEVR